MTEDETQGLTGAVVRVRPQVGLCQSRDTTPPSLYRRGMGLMSLTDSSRPATLVHATGDGSRSRQMPEYLDRLRFPADPWRLTESFCDAADLGVTETLFAVGNGYLGMRGNVEEGNDSHSHGTFINGFHETWPIRHPEEAFGLARVGQTIVNVPD